MKRIFSVFLGILSVLFCYSLGYSWDTDIAHPYIIQDAVAYLERNNILGPAELLNILRDGTTGTIDEDSGLIRSWFHYLGDGTYYPYNLDTSYTVASCDAIQWGFSNYDLECTANILGFPSNLTNDYKWQDAINQNNPNRWTALGHVLHLLADMAVPDHTRNDPHPESLFPSPPFPIYVFEQWAKAHLPERIIPTGDYLETLANPQDFLINLSNFTREHFFSKDTVFDNPIPWYWDDSNDPNYFYTTVEVTPGVYVNRRIAAKSFSYRRWGNLEDCNLDNNVFRDQFDMLYPKAVLYTASLIKHYYDLMQPPPPPPPTGLSQFKSDGVTPIPAGGTIISRTVVLKGNVSDPDGDQVKLQIELRLTSEAFTGVATHESGFMSSGSTASITVSNLSNGQYQWHGRAVDSNGAASAWVDAGFPGADFIVSVPIWGEI
jgi:hypothetical protein